MHHVLTISEFLAEIGIFQRIFRLIGIAPSNISSPSKRVSLIYTTYCSLVIILTILLIYYSLIFRTSIYTERQSIAKLLDTTSLLVTLITHIYVQFESWRKHKVLIKITKQFNEIDNELVNNFNVKFDRTFLKWRIQIPFSIIYTYTFATVIFLLIMHFYWTCCWIYCLFSLFAEFVIRWKYIQICIYIVSIDERMKMIGLQESKYLKELELTRFDSAKDREKVLNKINHFKDMYTKFWWICDSFNDCFGYTIVCLYTASFWNLITHIFWFYIGNETKLPSPEVFLVKLDAVLYPPPILLQLFIICKCCHDCTMNSQRTRQIWHTIPNSRNDSSLNHAIREVSLQLLHENIIFTAAGFFKLDFQALGGFILAATIYLVILLQFQIGE